ncbi:hypothetical protein [Ktedonobacter sp. SOSP1-85]|uniref:hypothetical protein n=1 Tax=Ktedonobacter sp. SOSP1-85 TaxID=2778367 RepID=UPI001914DDBE|nr:hypothetical protein [Ktedonobacter sp. SOSP1-85]
MREPPHFLDEAPDEELKRLFEELIRASNTIELLVGVYRVVKPALIRALNQHLAQANPLSDYPTCRLLRLLLKDEEEMVVWGTQATTALTQAPEAAKIAHDWEKHLSWFLDAAGELREIFPMRIIFLPHVLALMALPILWTAFHGAISVFAIR